MDQRGSLVFFAREGSSACLVGQRGSLVLFPHGDNPAPLTNQRGYLVVFFPTGVQCLCTLSEGNCVGCPILGILCRMRCSWEPCMSTTVPVMKYYLWLQFVLLMLVSRIALPSSVFFFVFCGRPTAIFCCEAATCNNVLGLSTVLSGVDRGPFVSP